MSQSDETSRHEFETTGENINADSKLLKDNVHFWRQVVASISSLLAETCVGITFSFSGTLLPAIKDYINDEEGSWLASMNVFSMILGTSLSWYLGRRLGTKKSMSIMSVFWIIGWICLSMASDFITFLIGFMVVGFASGFNNIIAINYLIEMPGPRLRGTLTMFSTACSYFGILLGHLVSIVFPWRTAMRLCAIIPLMTLMTMYWSRESSYWLLHENHAEAAGKNFFWLRGKSAESQKEFQLIMSKRSKIDVEWRRGVLKNMFTRAYFQPLFISILMFTSQVCSGLEVILFYAEDIVTELSTNKNADMVLMLMDSVSVFCGILSSYLVQIISRRLIFFSSSTGCVLALLGIILAKFHDLSNKIVIACICSYMAIFSIGLGPIVWLVPAEIFPEVTRDVGIGASTVFYLFLTSVFVKIIPTMKASLGMVTVLWFFIGATSVFSILLYFVMPETKDVSLEEVENQMNQMKFLQFKLRRQR